MSVNGSCVSVVWKWPVSMAEQDLRSGTRFVARAFLLQECSLLEIPNSPRHMIWMVVRIQILWNSMIIIPFWSCWKGIFWKFWYTAAELSAPETNKRSSGFSLAISADSILMLLMKTFKAYFWLILLVQIILPVFSITRFELYKNRSSYYITEHFITLRCNLSSCVLCSCNGSQLS